MATPAKPCAEPEITWVALVKTADGYQAAAHTTRGLPKGVRLDPVTERDRRDGEDRFRRMASLEILDPLENEDA